MGFDILYSFCLKHFSFWEEQSEMWSEMYIGLHVKYRCYSCQILMKLEFSWQVSEKSSNIKFYENPSSVSRVVSLGPTDTTMLKSRISQFCERSQTPRSVFHSRAIISIKFETRFLIDHNFVGSLCDVAVRHDTWHCSYQRTPPSINCANWQAVSTHRSVA